MFNYPKLEIPETANEFVPIVISTLDVLAYGI
jgi:hypothetical protein